MSFAQATQVHAAAGIAIVDDPTDLDCFLEPHCAAAIWRRQMPAEVQTWLADVDPDRLPRGKVVLRPHAVAQTLEYLCDISDLPTGAECDWLQADILSMSLMVADLLDAQYVRMRLGVVTTNACRKFHVDALSARLVCTYRGSGTQYGIARDGEDPTRVFSVQAGAPILLRGELWPERPASGLVHRSPPIEGTGETRLVLVLDPVFDLKGEA